MNVVAQAHDNDAGLAVAVDDKALVVLCGTLDDLAELRASGRSGNNIRHGFVVRMLLPQAGPFVRLQSSKR